MRRIEVLAGILIMMAIVGCGPKVTPIGPGYIYEPDEREQRLWQASKEESEGMRSGGAILYNAQLEAYVQGVLDRVLGNNLNAYLPLKPKVYVLDSPVPNAFALSQGDIYVHTGLLGRIRNEAQLAMLLGHEIAHSTHRHMYQHSEQVYASTGAQSYVAVLSALGGSNIRSFVSGISQIITTAAISGYSRDKEEEADQVGLTLMTQAGYDPREGGKMFEAMAKAAEKDDSGANFLYATHPKMDSRVRSCNRLLERMPSELLANATEIGEQEYLRYATNLIFDEVERHIAQGRFDLAIETLDYLVRFHPENDRTFVLLGDLYRARNESGDVDRCKKAYETALETNGASSGAHKGLGFLFVREGEKTDATSHLQKYLELSPTAPDTSYVRQYLLRLQGGD